jgi:AcrR family transcriptional regulator
MRKESAKTMGSAKRDEIIRQAYTVFYKNGFHASGVDSLLEGTGISKRTLYKHFGSKEALIQATLDYYQQNSFQALSDFIAASKVRTSTAKVLLIFDWLETIIESGQVLGCYAMNAKLEYSNRDQDISRCCENYFAKVENLIADLIHQTGCKDAKNAGRQLMILFQGAIVGTRGSKNLDYARSAKIAAKVLLAHRDRFEV